jgi:predicted amidophosphoribosyltransferase
MACDVKCAKCGKMRHQEDYRFCKARGTWAAYYEKICKICRNEMKRAARRDRVESRPEEVNHAIFNVWRGPVDPLPWRVAL